MITKNRFYYALTILMLGTLFLAACGGDTAVAPDVQADEHEEGGDEHGDEHEMSGSSFEDAETITIIATEFGFEPASIELHAGEPVNIMLVNEGVIEHELNIEAFDFHVHTEAGESAMVGLVPDKSGTFDFACQLSGHQEAGMAGDLYVE